MQRYSEFGRWLKERRKTLDMTREKLAMCAGCSPATIEKIEIGVRRPSAQLAELLGRCLSISDDEIASLVIFARGGHAVPSPGEDGAPGSLLPVSSTFPATHLPSQATNFIGREREVEEVRRLLAEREVRILTLLGPPGIGKTRLSLQVAASLAVRFPDGIFFVAFASVKDATLAIREIARAVGVREEAHQGIAETLRERLQRKKMLLVLDNFEHLLASAPDVASLAAAAPGLKTLVTSRAALRAYGEHLFRVPPMSFPDVGVASGLPDLEQLETLSQYEAIILFVQRARSVQHDFALTRENLPAVAAICRKLDGLPLAIELAAFRANVLSPQTILEKLEHSLDLLANGPTDLPERQRSLRGAVAWSYSLLTPRAQLLFSRLSVFVAGCDLQAVEYLDQAMPGPEDGDEGRDIDGAGASLLDTLAALVDSSMLRRHAAQEEPRFLMLETVREYAAERMARSGEEQRARQAHAEYYLGMAERSEPGLQGPDQAELLGRLERDHDNLRTVLHYFSHREDHIALARLAGALRRFWYFRGHLSEGLRWLDIALSHRDVLPLDLVARVLQGAGTLHWVIGDLKEASSSYGESLTIYRALGDRKGVASLLNNLGITLTALGDYGAPPALYEESLQISRELGDHWSVAVTLSNMGLSALTRDNHAQAEAYLAESLELRRALNDRQGEGQSMNNLGLVARCRGDYGQAWALHEESLQIFRDVSDTWSEAITLANMAYVALEEGTDWGQAASLFTLGLALYRELSVRPGIADCIEGLACVAAKQGESERAAVLFGGAERLRDVLGMRTAPYNMPLYGRSSAATIAALGEPAFQVGWRRGSAMGVETLCAYASGGMLQ